MTGDKQMASRNDRDREIARAALVESMVARRNDDDEKDIDYIISLDKEMFEAKIKAVLPDVRIQYTENEIIVSRDYSVET
jgi:hypothetical protein